MSREARMFLQLRIWIDDRRWDGHCSFERMQAMEWRLVLEASALIGFMA